ncbi:MAG: T9SS type A sorting domain-containing protein [Bacteroidales bacterium]|nr:T9SS type A sorting domain-containing protein [Bacteroidales bacterium]
MRKIVVIFTFIIIALNRLWGTSWYVDPINGSMSNNGSINSPWTTINDLIVNNKIKSYKPASFPYSYYASQVIINSSAPISGGDTIYCLSGNQGHLVISNYYNQLPIVIMPYQNASVEFLSIKIVASSNWIFKGIRVSQSFSGQVDTVSSNTPFLVEVQSHNWLGPCWDITFDACEVYTVDEVINWTANDWNAFERGGMICRYPARKINFKNNILRNIRYGIQSLSDSSEISNNYIINFSEDGIRHQGNSIRILNNNIRNSYATNASYHRDGIQALVKDTMKNIIIEGNAIIQFDPVSPHSFISDLQGITGFNEGFHKDWVITNNLIVVDSYHGITLCGALNCKFINNTIIDAVASNAYIPKLWIDSLRPTSQPHYPSVDNIIINNAAPNFTLISDSYFAETNYLADVSEYNALFLDPANFDFHLTATSSLRNTGSSTFAPLNDIEGILRPLGNAFDIGCYEYYECPILQSFDTTSICQNDTFYWGQQIIYLPGNYIDTIASSMTGCDSILYLNVMVYPKPFFSLGNDTTVCSLFELTINANGNSYMWSTSDTTDSILLHNIGTNTVWATVSNEHCYYTDTITVNILSPPVVNIIPFPDSVYYCVNSLVNLSVDSNYNSYLWSTNQTSNSININNSVAGIYTYTVTVVDSNGCVASDDIVLHYDMCDNINSVNDNNYQVYPNPVSDKIFIKGLNGKEHIRLLDVGSKEYAYIMNSNYSVDVSLLNEGLYILEIETNNEIMRFKLIKAKIN